MLNQEKYKPVNPIRIVSAASLFDGHDATINIIRRILQGSGAEVIHLGHNRTVQEIVNCAIQEDVQAIAVTSYQGGHIDYFKYMYDLLHEKGAGHIKIFGGGGGVILPHEIKELMDYGIARIYSPDDGRTMGLQGMINDLLEQSDFKLGDVNPEIFGKLDTGNHGIIASVITAFENKHDSYKAEIEKIQQQAAGINIPVIGITGTGGAGKSSLVDELIRRFVNDFTDKKLAIVSIDPTRRKTGGALLGDRIRMNSVNHPNVYMRSLATRESNIAVSKYVPEVVSVLKVAGFDLILLETSGIGQSDSEIIEFSDLSVYVMTPEFGAPTQLEKIDMLDWADIIVINKFDKHGAADALRDVRKQYERNHELWHQDHEKFPVFGTIASQFNDTGVNFFYKNFVEKIHQVGKGSFISAFEPHDQRAEKITVIPPSRKRYLSEISESIRKYNHWVNQQADFANQLHALEQSAEIVRKSGVQSTEGISMLEKEAELAKTKIDNHNLEMLLAWDDKKQQYINDEYIYKVREKEIRVQTHTTSLSKLKIPKIAMPAYTAWGDILKWLLQENVPGEFPYTSGVFPFKREEEDPTRMFAGEGAPERTNKRFHFLSAGMPAIRLSTAYDSVTLYGEDPGKRPDIYGKIGNSGVSVTCLDDSKKLYSGFRLCSPKTSVSMTINGPAPILTAFFMNTAIDQECEVYIRQNGLEEQTRKTIEKMFREKGLEVPKYRGNLPEGNDGLGLMLLGISGDQVLPDEIYQKIKADTISKVRGTVQADILKEDQAQNTCIFSTDFALKMMGDMQEYFILNNVQNFYSVSISGYHIAEAGANPLTQLAFTLANGFTYIEYYLHRGMDINAFAPNLSFFFSNGIDPEYAVLGRVARRIWAKALKLKYNADSRSQKLKYHIQTSGRSLHAQEIDFNDIRTTLQALYAIYDNCNSLHTNAYDEAITTPTEESVRRAMAIQMIINHELGLAKNQNPLQGAFIIDQLTDLVEEAVLSEFDRITERGGVLGAMETMYQRNKIQEESLYYEMLKNTGKLPIMGVNTFLSSKGSPTMIQGEVIRATEEEKQNQLRTVEQMHQFHRHEIEDKILELQHKAAANENIFEYLMELSKYCTIGQITQALYNVGGQYRRNM
jgi:isobutyryl-CoA mutase